MSEQRKITVEDLVDFSWSGASNASFSPDGRSVVYEDRGGVWVVDMDGENNRRLLEGANPRWHPSGDGLAFRREGQVWLRNANGEERPVTACPTEVQDYQWSPDGRSLALIRPLPESASESDSPALLPTIVEVHRGEKQPPGAMLEIVELDTGKTRSFHESVPGNSLLWMGWSPDGRRLAFGEDVGYSPDNDLGILLFTVGLDGQPAVHLAGRDRRQTLVPRWSPDGRRIAVPFSPYESASDYHFECGVFPATGGEPAIFASVYFVDPVCWHPDNRTVLFGGGYGSRVQIMRVDTETGAIQPLTDESGIHGHDSRLDISPDGSRVVCNYVSPSAMLPEICWVATDGSGRKQITNATGRLDAFELGEAEIVRWKAPDGLMLEGALVKPVGYQPGKRYPAVIALHGGPVRGGNADIYPEWLWLAGEGYLVFAPDFRGGMTYGWCDYARALTEDVTDTLSGIDWLVDAGYADPDRIGLHGFSYGAALASRIMSQTDRLRAAVILGCRDSDWTVAYGSAWNVGGGANILANGFGGRPWEVPETYRELSLLTNAHKIRTPTLMLHGEQDNIVQAELLYTWMHQGGAEVEFIKYLGEGHMPSKREHKIDYWSRTQAWFRKHLGS